MDDFLLRAWLAGLGIAAVTGPLGSFVVWRRMAYFGDTLAHAALLGIALGLLLEFGRDAGIVVVCVAVALLLMVLQRSSRLASDTLLGILSHTALAVGLVAIALTGRAQVDLAGFLFGDILAVTRGELYAIWAGGAAVLGVLALIWRPLLASTVHEDLARVEGVPVARTRLIFMLLIAVVIALAMKMVGVLLITALLIVPAASARRIARDPEQMALLAAVAGAVAVTGGLAASLQFDTPAGPSVVCVGALLFALAYALPRRALPG